MHITNFTAGGKERPEIFLNILKNFLFDKKLVLYDDPRNSSEATFTRVPNRNRIKPVLFLEGKFACVHRGAVCFRTSFVSVQTDTQRKHFPPKQTKEISCAYKIQQTPPNEG